MDKRQSVNIYKRSWFVYRSNLHTESTNILFLKQVRLFGQWIYCCYFFVYVLIYFLKSMGRIRKQLMCLLNIFPFRLFLHLLTFKIYVLLTDQKKVKVIVKMTFSCYKKRYYISTSQDFCLKLCCIIIDNSLRRLKMSVSYVKL